jgi:hypothetical protein
MNRKEVYKVVEYFASFFIIVLNGVRVYAVSFGACECSEQKPQME